MTPRNPRSKLWLLVILLSVIAVRPAFPEISPSERNLTTAERAWVAASVYRTVKQYFAHWAALPPSYDFDEHFRDYLPEAMAAPDRRSFSLATMRLMASLENGHTGFVDDAFYADRRLPPFYAEPIEGRWTVTVSRLRQLPLGSVIEAIDGVPMERWIVPIEAVIGASSHATRDNFVFLTWFMMPERFTLTLNDGRRVPIDRAGPLGPRQGHVTPDEVTVDRRADGVVVIGIPSFDEPRFETTAAAAIRATKDARLVLLDVRGNGGGSTPYTLLKTIMTRPYTGTVVVTPLTVAENEAHGSFSPEDNPAPNSFLRYGPEVLKPVADAYDGRMALLIDRECGSACEDFAIRFQSGHRGPVLGEPSDGSTGQPIQVKFPEFGMSLRVSTKRETLADGHQFEGVGVLPDISVPTRRADIVAASDTILERAIAISLTGKQ